MARRSYKEIALALAAEKGIEVTAGGIMPSGQGGEIEVYAYEARWTDGTSHTCIVEWGPDVSTSEAAAWREVAEWLDELFECDDMCSEHGDHSDWDEYRRTCL